MKKLTLLLAAVVLLFGFTLTTQAAQDTIQVQLLRDGKIVGEGSLKGGGSRVELSCDGICATATFSDLQVYGAPKATQSGPLWSVQGLVWIANTKPNERRNVARCILLSTQPRSEVTYKDLVGGAVYTLRMRKL